MGSPGSGLLVVAVVIMVVLSGSRCVLVLVVTVVMGVVVLCHCLGICASTIDCIPTVVCSPAWHRRRCAANVLRALIQSPLLRPPSSATCPTLVRSSVLASLQLLVKCLASSYLATFRSHRRISELVPTPEERVIDSKILQTKR